MDEGSRANFMRQLVEGHILIPMGVPGVFGRSALFEDMLTKLGARIDAWARHDGAERVAFPPVIPREVLRKTGYMDNFPQLCGSVHAFVGDDAGHAALLQRVVNGHDWTDCLRQTDLVLAPATCYPLYPTLTGGLPPGGRLFDLASFCFRHEPSDDPARLQAFRMRENVRIGEVERVKEWRAMWMERCPELLESLDLEAILDTATDPFFGRGGRMMKSSQATQALKFELLVPIWCEDAPTAVASFNYHGEHFGNVFDIHTAAGTTAHTACVGFGLERIALAVLKRHGLVAERWPVNVRATLGV